MPGKCRVLCLHVYIKLLQAAAMVRAAAGARPAGGPARSGNARPEPGEHRFALLPVLRAWSAGRTRRTALGTPQTVVVMVCPACPPHLTASADRQGVIR